MPKPKQERDEREAMIDDDRLDDASESLGTGVRRKGVPTDDFSGVYRDWE